MLSIIYAQLVKDGVPNTLTDNDTVSGLETIFSNIVSTILPLGGVVLFVLLMYGGIEYITAGANPSKVQQARNTITYGIIGMIVLSMAFMILVLIQLITGANVTTFRLNF